MSHRGPDGEGIWFSKDGRIGLAHRRLAIVDLSSAGKQPMTDTHGSLEITFNGEIYNHQDLRIELQGRGHVFRSQSDTEVILEAYRAWGIDCVGRFNGMFAFSLYDSSRRMLFMARDRAGEKPLYYVHTPRRFSFSSELKGLMADATLRRKINSEALDFYLAYGYVPGDRCILSGVHKLAPAHALIYDISTDKVRVWRYWQLPDPAAAAEATIEELTDDLKLLLQDSVRRQLMADVPVGVLLSGGIDSSLVTAMAAQCSSKPVRTFTIDFPGHGSFSEGPFARMVATHFGTEHTELVAEPSTLDLLPELARQFDEPMCDSSMIPTFILSRLIRKHCTVALGGDGADELFGGYPQYSWVQKQERMRRFVPSFARAVLSRTAARCLPVGYRGRNYLMGFGAGIENSIAHVNMFFDRRSRRNLLRPEFNKGLNGSSAPESFKRSLCARSRGLPGEAMAADFMSYLPEDILVKVDRASMLSSLEVRAPWLDYRIIEFAFSRVPNSLRATEDERKILPRRLAASLLPKELDLKRKQGFSIPLKNWFKGEWGRYIAEILTDPSATMFDKTAVCELIENQKRGYGNTERLFALTLFELWRREYKVEI
jgi:asparagine synthase (glutamine-hydrolysing)